jgi:hypothetical protein
MAVSPPFKFSLTECVLAIIAKTQLASPSVEPRSYEILRSFGEAFSLESVELTHI